jgi:hypothetical protein
MHGGDVPEEAERLWRRAMKIQQEKTRAEERARSLCGPEVLAELLAREVKRKKVKGKSGSEGVQEDRAHDPATSPPHHPTAEELAREMKTDHRGTTLQSLAEAARRHGFAAKGLRLTFAGLLKVASGNGVQVFGSSPKPLHSPGQAGVQGAKGKRRGDGAIAGRFLPPHSHTPIRPYLIALIRPGHFVLVERLNFAEVQVWDPSGAGRGEAARRRMTREEWEQTWDGVALVVSPAALGSGGTGDGG